MVIQQDCWYLFLITSPVEGIHHRYPGASSIAAAIRLRSTNYPEGTYCSTMFHSIKTPQKNPSVDSVDMVYIKAHIWPIYGPYMAHVWPIYGPCMAKIHENPHPRDRWSCRKASGHLAECRAPNRRAPSTWALAVIAMPIMGGKSFKGNGIFIV